MSIISLDEETAETLSALIYRLSNSITSDASGAPDAAGGFVTCLTSALMGNTAGLCKIANAINDLAEAVRENNGDA